MKVLEHDGHIFTESITQLAALIFIKAPMAPLPAFQVVILTLGSANLISNVLERQQCDRRRFDDTLRVSAPVGDDAQVSCLGNREPQLFKGTEAAGRRLFSSAQHQGEQLVGQPFTHLEMEAIEKAGIRAAACVIKEFVPEDFNGVQCVLLIADITTDYSSAPSIAQ
jgi:hypothetical protein